jgi:Domain of unknown function (DUF4129)
MKRKTWLLLISIGVMLAIVLLASSLHDVHFQPGRPASVTSSASRLILPVTTETLAETPLWKLLVFWAAFAINLILFFYLLPPDVRKRVIRQMIRFALTILILIFALRYRLIRIPFLNLNSPGQPGQQPLNLGSNLPPPIFQPPALTPWMTYLITIGVLLLVLILVWAASTWWSRSRARQFSPLDAIASIAQNSLGDLASGRNLGDVIIKSYARMSEVVSSKRGFHRNIAMTPREFADRLDRAGLPGDPIMRLTRLFESVRYGARSSTQSDINEAVECLNSILRACGAIE